MIQQKGFFAIAAVCLIRCSDPSEATLQKLQGHWHLAKSLTTSYDFVDTLLVVNKYSLVGQTYRFSVYDSARKRILLPGFWSESFLPGYDAFSIKNDSLIYHEDQTKEFIFLKSNPELCSLVHAFSISALNLSSFPKQKGRLINMDSLSKTSFMSIMVGKPKYSALGTDPKIQVHDVFIQTSDIPTFVQRSYDGGASCLLLAIDQNIRKSFADSVIRAIPKIDSLKILRLVEGRGEIRYGYERLN
jgi:hypothetical protein